MPSQSQEEFFARLLGERDFGEKADRKALEKQFSELDIESSSAWIQKAMELPKKKGGTGGKTVPPPF